MQKRVTNNEKIEVLWNTEALEAKGDGKLLKSLRIVNNKTKEEKDLQVNGLFYAIGHIPATKILLTNSRPTKLVTFKPLQEQLLLPLKVCLQLVMFKIKFIDKPLLLLVVDAWLLWNVKNSFRTRSLDFSRVYF